MPCDGQDLADERQQELGLAVDDFGRRAHGALLEQRLRFHLGRDAEPLEHALDVRAARTVLRVRDRLRRKQRLLDRVGRADVVAARAGANTDTDAGAPQGRDRSRGEVAALRELRDDFARDERDVDGFAAGDALRVSTPTCRTRLRACARRCARTAAQARRAPRARRSTTTRARGALCAADCADAAPSHASTATSAAAPRTLVRGDHGCSACVVVMGPVPQTWITAGSSLAPS